MEVALVKFEGKPIEKFIEVVSQGIGTLYRPTAIRNEANAEAYKILTLESARSKASAESKLFELELNSTIQQRLIYQETKKQSNINQVLEIAADQINQAETVSAEKVDNDWTTRFFNISENISNEEMQQLWGRILAAEIKQPKSFSLRTLELLKNLSKEEAETFSKFAQLKIKTPKNDFIPYTDNNLLSTKFNITYKDILLMTELGLILSGTTLGITFINSDKSLSALYENGETGIYVITKPNKSKCSIHILAFTTVGSELTRLISYEKNDEYIKYVCSSLSTPYTSIKFGTLGFDENQERIFVDTYDFLQ